MTDPFTTATAYRIDGCDRYETPEECIVNWAIDCDLRSEREVRERMPTVHAYAVCERQQLDYELLAESMLTRFEDEYSDANLRLNELVENVMDQEAYFRCRDAVAAAVAEFAATLPVTKLTDKPVASRTYSADEVLTVLREVKPGWFGEVGNG